MSDEVEDPKPDLADDEPLALPADKAELDAAGDRGSQIAGRSEPPPPGDDPGDDADDERDDERDDARDDDHGGHDRDNGDDADKSPPAIHDLRSAIPFELELRRRSRRGFLTLGAGAIAGVAAWKWLRSRPPIDGLEWPLRRMLETNESLARAYFKQSRLSPVFRGSDLTPVRINGRIGLKEPIDLDTWRLHIEGAAQPVSLTLDEIKALPRQQMITELRCIEGWSIIVQWTGARLADLMARYPPAGDPRYVALETPDRGYYVGLDLESAMHPQTLLAYEINGQPLPLLHGAPLRLAIPVKYGIKNLKRIGTIRYTTVRPADFWAERGYDWYAGH
jgi:DMSO/TMAO reductase YedYZ molybdopterin-dependent catalytic subunit